MIIQHEQQATGLLTGGTSVPRLASYFTQDGERNFPHNKPPDFAQYISGSALIQPISFTI